MWKKLQYSYENEEKPSKNILRMNQYSNEEF